MMLNHISYCVAITGNGISWYDASPSTQTHSSPPPLHPRLPGRHCTGPHASRAGGKCGTTSAGDQGGGTCHGGGGATPRGYDVTSGRVLFYVGVACETEGMLAPLLGFVKIKACCLLCASVNQNCFCLGPASVLGLILGSLPLESCLNIYLTACLAVGCWALRRAAWYE